MLVMYLQPSSQNFARFSFKHREQISFCIVCISLLNIRSHCFPPIWREISLEKFGFGDQRSRYFWRRSPFTLHYDKNVFYRNVKPIGDFIWSFGSSFSTVYVSTIDPVFFLKQISHLQYVSMSDVTSEDPTFIKIG